MEQVELIHKFIDEGLDPITEQKLFENMAKNPSLRSEFKQYLSFERAALTDYAAFQPTISATNSIFSNLGISSVVSSTATTSAVVSFWSKYSGLIFTNIASIIVTAAILFLFNSKDYDKSSLLNSNNSNQPAIEQNTNIPVVTNESIDENKKTTQNVPEKIKYVYIQRKPIPEKEKETTTIQDELSTQSSQADLAILTNSLPTNEKIDADILTEFSLFTDNNQNKIQNIQLIPFNYATKSFDLDNISLMFTGNDSYSIPKSPLPRSSQPIFDSKSLILMYDITPSFSVGVDVRQEFYYLDYTGQVASMDFRYEQNTNFTSLGIVGKWNWLNYEHFKSFANLYVGGNKIGQIGRFMIGTEISPSKEYGFIIGVEGSLLRHLHQNREFFAKKIGLNYGIIFHF